MHSLRAIPTMLRIGFTEAFAYRAEIVVWVLSTVMPFVMLVLWTAVAANAPVLVQGRSWSSAHFVAYFLSMFVVQQLLSASAAWEINSEIRSGNLAMRLLRPVHPFVVYLAHNLSALPLRLAVTLPVIVALAVSPAAESMAHELGIWSLVPVALLGGWLITFFVQIAIGTMALYMDSSLRLMDAWLALWFVFSGYLFPTDLFPAWFQPVLNWLPFRYQIGLPVELMMGQHDFSEGLQLLCRQFGFAAACITISLLIWRGGLKRFQAFGG